jgi:hypothetical protein
VIGITVVRRSAAAWFVALVLLALGASVASAASVSIQAPASVKASTLFTMTVAGDTSGLLTVKAIPLGAACTPSGYGDYQGVMAWWGTTATAYNNATWPLGVSADNGPFSVTLTVSSDSIGPPGAHTLCAYLASGDVTDTGWSSEALGTAKIVVDAPPPDPSTIFRGCSVRITGISRLSATETTPCWTASADARGFATSACATRDGILLRTLGGNSYAACLAERRLVCSALAGPNHGRIRVGCGRIGAFGFVGPERLTFVYRLRRLG